MGVVIGLAGKGSTGKTTLAAALVRTALAWMPTADDGERSLLVVDVDPHQSLTEVLGHTGCTTVGQVRSQYERALLSGETARLDETREAMLERVMGMTSVVAATGYDFLSLGQWELPGSQCTPNRVLSRALVHLTSQYRLVILDNEAGIEHLGRYADVPMDALVIVTTPDQMAQHVTEKILAQAMRLPQPPRQLHLVINRVRERDTQAVARIMAWAASAGVALIGVVPEAPTDPMTLGRDAAWHTRVREHWTQLLEMVVPARVGQERERMRS